MTLLSSVLLQISTDTTEVLTAPEELDLFHLILKGGVVMIPIAILSVIVVYLTVERFLYLKSATQHPANFMETIKNQLRKGDIAGAKSFASHIQSATGTIIRHGLESVGRPMREIETTLESATNIEVAEMEKNMGYLGIIAGIAPMLGFIGTITGIIHIFYDISLSDNISIGIIAGGLYEKMITSGSGLIVGVISYTAYHLLHMRIQKFVLQIQKDAFEFTSSLQQK
ncbi:MAG TPA: MotA/TolQ/ExbB proton channel family protein [Ohtaekwangia sp.]